MRHRLLNSLRGNPATISQLARRLEVHKGSVAYHLKILLDAGMIRRAEQRRVRGGTETYFEVAVGRIVIPDNDRGSVSTFFAAMTPEFAADDTALLHLRHLNLTTEQAGQLRAALDAIVTHTAAAGNNGEATFGVLVGMYQRR
jgi:DNA-binding transcriptional ArsR family regulator